MIFDLEICSPVQQIKHPLFDEKGLQVFIKRDDMIHPVISGNKWRKLKYTLANAHEAGKTHLVTFGGAYSNHLLATAAAAAKFGFKSTGFVRGEEVTNDTLFLCRLHGMQLIFDLYFGNDPSAFFIDEGGASAAAAQGCSELVAELPEVYDHLFCACGTGTTAAGILNGLQHLPTLFHAISVLKGGEFIADEIKKYTTHNPMYELHTQYHFGGYAKTTPELIDFIKQFIASTGILIEPVYTGKMMYALFDLAHKDHFKPGSSILAVHTGGLFGLLGMKEKFL
jgi:1-aminocyclopropane-1-carboxylate deaminase